MPPPRLCNKIIRYVGLLYSRLSILKLGFLTFLSLFIYNNKIFSQENNFRRHFIIAYDVSSPFVNAERSNPAFKQALIDLFSNKSVTGADEANQSNLQIEQSNKVPFFDQYQDEISFFHFNIANSEFGELRNSINKSEKEIIGEFNNIFLKNKQTNWSDYKRQNPTDIGGYIGSLFAINRTPTILNYHVSISNFVYPLVLNEIEKDKYAKEYILILLSDFLSGSMQGNKQDFNRIKEAYGYSPTGPLPPNSAPAFIKKFSDGLASKYYKIDFFDFAFSGSPQPGIIGFKIKPQAGSLTPEDISIFVDADIDLYQRGYQSRNFSISDTRIKFTHNKYLKPQEVYLKILLPNKDSEIVLFNDVIATRQGDDSWVSDYTNSSKLLLFDSIKSSYYIPKLKIKLDSAINNKGFDYLSFTYEFKTNYTVDNANPLSYIYKAERQLPKSNISFTTKTTMILLYYGIPAILLIALVLLLINRGKPRHLVLDINGYLDSYQVIDYKKVGKLLTPYKYWDNALDNLPINVEVLYKRKSYPFNWNSIVKLKLINAELPAGFDIFLKENNASIREFSPGHDMSLKRSKINKLNFFVCIRQNDINSNLTEPRLAKFTIEATIKDSVLFFKTDVYETLEYKFHLGPDLGDVWVGLDPGTSGSCIAVGSHGDNILMGKYTDKGSTKTIVSSKIVFDKASNYSKSSGGIPEDTYKTGTLAETLYGAGDRYLGFQSIKKLLGFKDTKIIQFKNGATLSVSGKELSGLLVKDLYKLLKSSINISLPAFRDYLDRNGQFNPRRAVIAIPNNFTISKIQDMIDCVDILDQFKEVRYVYEAEAVLFHYLSNFKRFNPDASAFDEETILIFDMGGATINATVVKADKTNESGRTIYDIDFLSKIGYGIGGDTIDFCLIKFLLSFSDEYFELRSINISEQTAELSRLSFEIKEQIVDNYHKGHNYLITAAQLQAFLRNRLNIDISIDEESRLYHFFKKNSRGHFELFTTPLFLEWIYNNIKDAVKEVIELSEAPINKVVFSGRSVYFPYVKETVMKQFELKKKYPAFIHFEFEESKTAVAQGAAWYGINKNAIRLNNLKTNASFGVKRTLSADKTDVEFIGLVEMGCAFDDSSDDIGFFMGTKKISDTFSFDGAKVNYYQIMGKDADKILSQNQKHKFSKIAGIQLPLATTEVAIKVSEDDDIECAVRLVSEHVKKEKGVVSDQEIEDANDEHYTWII